MLALEVIVLLTGIAALIFSAITLNSLTKIKSKCPTIDPKEYNTARGFQIAQLAASILVIVLSGYIAATGKSPLAKLRKYLV